MANPLLLSSLMAPTPESQRYQLASQMLMQQGPAQNPSRSPIEGLARMLTQIGGAYIGSRGMQRDEDQRNAALGMLSDAGSGDRQGLIKSMLSSDNPYAKQIGGSMLLSSMEPGKPENLSLQTVLGPNGKPMLVQAGNRGTISPVQGYGPLPSASKDEWKQIEPGHWRNFATGEETNDPGVFERAMALHKAGGTSVNTQVSPTSIYTHETGAGMEQLYKGIGNELDKGQTDASAAAQTANNIKQLNVELQGVPTGMGAEARTLMLKTLRATGLTGNAANAEIAKREAAQRLAGQAVMDQLNAMKGPATEKEYTNIERINPTIATTPEGRAEMQRIAEHQAARLRAVADADAKVMNDLQQKNIQIGDAAKARRQMHDQINTQFDNMLTHGGKPSASPTPPAKIKIDVNGNIIP